MNTFGTNDTVFASATRMGHVIFNICLCGVSSIESILALLRKEKSRGDGLLNLKIRNLTQGWSHTMALY